MSRQSEQELAVEQLKNAWERFNSGTYSPGDVRDWLHFFGGLVAQQDMSQLVLRKNDELSEKLNAVKKIVCEKG